MPHPPTSRLDASPPQAPERRTAHAPHPARPPASHVAERADTTGDPTTAIQPPGRFPSGTPARRPIQPPPRASSMAEARRLRGTRPTRRPNRPPLPPPERRPAPPGRTGPSLPVEGPTPLPTDGTPTRIRPEPTVPAPPAPPPAAQPTAVRPPANGTDPNVPPPASPPPANVFGRRSCPPPQGQALPTGDTLLDRIPAFPSAKPENRQRPARVGPERQRRVGESPSENLFDPSRFRVPPLLRHRKTSPPIGILGVLDFSTLRPRDSPPRSPHPLVPATSALSPPRPRSPPTSPTPMKPDPDYSAGLPSFFTRPRPMALARATA